MTVGAGRPALREQLEALVAEMVARGILYEDGRREFELRYISRALEAAGGNVSAAADRLGLHRNTLRRKIAEHRLKVRR